MKSTGIIRKVDELGRVVLPIELRKTLDINIKDSIEIFTSNEKIVLKKYNPADIFTGEMDDLIEYHGKKVSKKSIIEMAKIADFNIENTEKDLLNDNLEEFYDEIDDAL